MRVALAALVTFVCVLLGVDLLEYAGSSKEGAALKPRPPISAGAAAQHPAAAELNLALPALQGWASTILGRPLFNPSRRPGRQAVASTVLPRLAGIIVGPAGSSAIFADPGSARAMIVVGGGHAGPYLVRAVSPSGVSVLGPSGPELLHPAYDHDAASGGPAAAPAAAPPSLLDLLRARVQNHGGLPPIRGPAPSLSPNRDSRR